MVSDELMTNIFRYLKGSTSSDFKPDVTGANSPFDPCPGSPNCVRISRHYKTDSEHLYNLVNRALKSISPHQIEEHSQELQINSVYRISVFGFRDDVQVKIEPHQNGSVMHLRSSSREGKSDLGVNRRRVQQILHYIQSNL